MSQPTQPQVINLCAHIGRFTLWIKLRALHSLVWVSLGALRVFPAEPIVMLVYDKTRNALSEAEDLHISQAEPLWQRAIDCMTYKKSFSDF